MVTTCMARTFLQPQMNKANTATTPFSGGDVNPKDHIIYRNRSGGTLVAQLVGFAQRDNTGHRYFVPDRMFPTLTFPSDHCIVSSEIEFGKNLKECDLKKSAVMITINNIQYIYWEYN